ncbi:nucleotide exchange factor GrpE [Ferrimicrobium acidiphilum]|uniref:Protein GrpE n=1 Tax=Ferrimicrobium acidiphilum DSM 19497 TaxID=1121877 RepID=A0A0D8FVC0_9ACTN|nr:nucleotide exchange factor GrpE [Ferrimicrobium acidiphilum]KJE77223.1 protein GrpE [Ferrimicrobium acidiphilum DSM 19497]
MADERFDEEPQSSNERQRAEKEAPFDGEAPSNPRNERSGADEEVSDASGDDQVDAGSSPEGEASTEDVKLGDPDFGGAERSETGESAEAEFDLDALDFEPEINDPLADAERERDSYLEALQHLQADFENYKKRVLRQQSELGAAGSRNLVTKLLPALDTLTLALAHATSESGSDEVASVLSQISAAFVEVLAKEGLEVIEPLGKRFNPEEAEAVAHEDGDGEPTVSEVFRVGYRWHGQTLRPAMVKVTGS